MFNNIYKETYLALTLSLVIFKNFIFNMMAGNFFQEILSHYHQKITGVFLQKPLVVRHVFMVRLGNTLP